MVVEAYVNDKGRLCIGDPDGKSIVTPLAMSIEELGQYHYRSNDPLVMLDMKQYVAMKKAKNKMDKKPKK